MKIQKSFCRIVSAHRVILNGCLYERNDIVHALHIALLSGKNIYLIGPGGEGKSLIAFLFSLLCRMRFFNQQFHSFTKIDDWEGPVDMAKL